MLQVKGKPLTPVQLILITEGGTAPRGARKVTHSRQTWGQLGDLQILLREMLVDTTTLIFPLQPTRAALTKAGPSTQGTQGGGASSQDAQRLLAPCLRTRRIWITVAGDLEAVIPPGHATAKLSLRDVSGWCPLHGGATQHSITVPGYLKQCEN